MYVKDWSVFVCGEPSFEMPGLSLVIPPKVGPTDFLSAVVRGSPVL